ncbi:MAG: helix-turn-helix transcriptional regulator [Alphaproteobacteria bacterium]|nr:helix-turn-helix transcriptional regulator [Alphaproteobacteria bacterium]
MITNPLFRVCLAQVSEKTRAEFNLSFEIADRIDAILKEKGLTQKELAKKMGKRESEVSRWLTGRHNFTTNTLADISLALGEPIIIVPHRNN